MYHNKNIECFHNLPKFPHATLQSTLPIPLSSSPSLPLINFLSVQCCFSRMSYWDHFLWLWLISLSTMHSFLRFISVFAWIRSILPFFVEYYYIVWTYQGCSSIHQFKDIWVASSMGWLQLSMLWIFSCRFLCVHVSILLGLQSCTLSLCLTV